MVKNDKLVYLNSIKYHFIETLTDIYKKNYRYKLVHNKLYGEHVISYKIQRIGWFGIWWNTDYRDLTQRDAATILHHLAKSEAVAHYYKLEDKIRNGKN